MNQEEVVLKKTSLINPLISVNIVQKSEKFEDDLKQDLVRDLLTDKAMDENNYSYRQDRRGGVNYGSETIIVTNSRNRAKHDLATAYGFNEDDIALFEETFQIFDKDRDGSITINEIRTVMNALGFFPCDEKIQKSISDIDSDGDGTVDFEEFICMMSKSRNEIEMELKEIFQIFDRNGDGFIDKTELKDVMVRLGEKISDEEVNEMIREADIDGDNKVSLIEFRTILRYEKRNRFSQIN